MNLFSAASANGDSSTISPRADCRGNYRTFKTNISGTATVTLYGRMDPNDATWAQLAQFTASGVVAVLLPPQIKATISGASGATVSAWIDCFQ